MNVPVPIARGQLGQYAGFLGAEPGIFLGKHPINSDAAPTMGRSVSMRWPEQRFPEPKSCRSWWRRVQRRAESSTKG